MIVEIIKSFFSDINSTSSCDVLKDDKICCLDEKEAIKKQIPNCDSIIKPSTLSDVFSTPKNVTEFKSTPYISNMYNPIQSNPNFKAPPTTYSSFSSPSQYMLTNRGVFKIR